MSGKTGILVRFVPQDVLLPAALDRVTRLPAIPRKGEILSLDGRRMRVAEVAWQIVTAEQEYASNSPGRIECVLIYLCALSPADIGGGS